MRLALVLVLSTVLSACGSRIDAMSDTLRYAFSGDDGVSLTQDQISKLTYPAQYVTVADNPRVLVGLGFDYQGHYKWQSQDKRVLTTANGRLINTQGLAFDIVQLFPVDSQDPLTCIAEPGQSAQKRCALDWQYQVQIGRGVNAYSENVSATFKQMEQDQVITLASGVEYTVSIWEETIRNHAQWRNVFYVEAQTGRVIKSSQKVSSDSPRINFEEVKAYKRDLDGERLR